MMKWRLRLQIAGTLGIFVTNSAPLSGQARVCNIVTPTTNLVRITRDDGTAVTYLSQPRVRCNDGTFIQADSSESFEATSFHRFFGNVIFLDADRRLSSENAQYFSETGTLRAQGHVEVVDPDGSVITGERLTLLQAGENREEDDLLMTTGRPRALLYPSAASDSTTGRDSTAVADSVAPEPVEPYDVTAGRIRFIGRRIFQARTRVEITRETMRAFADSTAFDQDVGTMILYENARVLDQGEDTVDIRGDTITMQAPGNVLESIIARREGRVITPEVDLKGSEVRIYFGADEEVDRVVAVRILDERVVDGFFPPDTLVGDAVVPVVDSTPPDAHPVVVDTLLDESGFAPESTIAMSGLQPQPSGIAEDFLIQGDSIEVDSPGGVLTHVYAVGMAYGESSSRDSLNTTDTPDELRKDWIRGDTLIITFLPPDSLENDAGGGPPAEDTTERQSRIESLWAIGSASTLYRTMPRDTVGLRPGKLDVNYLLGDMIKLFMENGEVDRMEAENARGVFLQPARPARPDTTVVPDTTSRSDAPAKPTGGRMWGNSNE